MAITYRFTVRRGLAADWTAQNPVLLKGEFGLETDTGLKKMGDGVTAWNILSYDTITQDITNGDTTHAPSGDAVFGALAGTEPKIPAGDSSQFYRGDKTLASALDGPFTSSGSGAGLFFQNRSGDSSQNWAWYSDQDKTRLFRGRDVLEIAEDGSITSIGSASSDTRLFFTGGVGSPTKAGALNFSTAAGADAAGVVSIQRRTTAGAFEANLWQLLLSSGENTFGGSAYPIFDNASTCGRSSNRWSQVYAANGTINTSDAREKTAPRDLTDAELAAAADLARLPSIFQWLHAIAEKGDAARLHCSPTVQSVIAIMESHGLDPFRYGFVCYDEWDETPEIKDEDTGQVTQEFRPAGNRYSLRPSELAHFIMRGLAWRQDALERRLAALESQ